MFFVVSFGLLLTTGSVLFMCIARFLQGLGIGFVMCVQPMYIGEISTDDVRGALGSFMQLFIVSKCFFFNIFYLILIKHHLKVGVLYVDVIGPYVSYYSLQWACLAVPIAFVSGFFMMPETPAYHIQKGNKDDAIHSLMFLRGMTKESVQDELSVIQTSVDEALKTKSSILDVFKNRASVKALIISVGLIAFQQLSGINAILFYSTSIFIKAGGESGGALDPALSTILVGVVSLLAAGITPLIADRLGRQIILLFSAAGMAVSLVSSFELSVKMRMTTS